MLKRHFRQRKKKKKRIGELDKLIKSTFEQFILGNLEEELIEAMNEMSKTPVNVA